MTIVDKDRTLQALAETWSSIISLCEGLTDDDWRGPTDCPGWSVQDQVAHMVGTEKMLAGQQVPALDVERFEYLKNPTGRSNEAWVEERRSRPPASVLDEFRSITSERLPVLRALTQDDFDAESPTPAGPDTFGRFIQIRVMDCWVHEQDIREAVRHPGHQEGLAVDVALDEVVTALGFVVGKQAGAPSGSSVRFELTGGSARTIDVVVEDRARASAQRVERPTTSLEMPVVTFMRLVAGRTDPEPVIEGGGVVVHGDDGLGHQVIGHLAYMI